MKRSTWKDWSSFFVTVGLFVGFLSQANASCPYSRVSVDLENCKEVSAAELKDLVRPETDLPDLTTTDEGKLMHVWCSCEYEYYGANQLCDNTQTHEFDSAMGTDNKTNPCAEAKTFCEHLCPRTLN